MNRHLRLQDPGGQAAAPHRPAGAGLTPRELAKVVRMSPDRIRAMIQSGELGAINTASARCERPRYVILPHHLAAWEQDRRAAQPKPARRRKRTAQVDYFPD
jgi:hypothetical protein